MSDALSIRAAAADAGGAPALSCGGQTYGFDEIAELVERELPALARDCRDGRPYPLVAGNTLAAVVTRRAAGGALRLAAVFAAPGTRDPEGAA